MARAEATADHFPPTDVNNTNSNTGDKGNAMTRAQAIAKVLEYLFLLQKHHGQDNEQNTLRITLKEDPSMSSTTRMYSNVVIEADGTWTHHFNIKELFNAEVNALLSTLVTTVGTFETDVKNLADNTMQHADVTVDENKKLCINFSRTDCRGDEKGLHCQFMIVCMKEILLPMVLELESYIHSMYLLNVMPLTQFDINTSTYTVTKIFGADVKGRVSTCGKRFATDIIYFGRSSDAVEAAIRLCHKSSSKFMILSPVLPSGNQTSLKLFVTAATIPHQTNVCSTRMLNIYFFGPDGLPLFLAGAAQCSVGPFQLANWEEFGMQIGPQLDREYSNHGLILPNQSYHLLTPSTDNHSIDCHSLQLIIFIDFNTEHTVPEKKEIIEALQSNFGGIVIEQPLKFKRATHRALSKLWHKTPKTRDKQKTFERSIPTVVKAIGVILKHSTNEEFRTRCYDKLQVSNSSELSSEMTDRLWFIASQRHSVTQPPGVENYSVTQPPGVHIGRKSSEERYNASPSHQHLESECLNLHIPSAVPKSIQPQTSFEEFGDIGLLVYDEMKELEEIIKEDSKEPVQSARISAADDVAEDDWFSEVLLECDWLKSPEA